jgi:hypothetical protein
MYLNVPFWIAASDASHPSMGSVEMEAPPSLNVLVNNTVDTSDDITVLSPAQTIPIQVTLSGANGTVALSVSPAGRASLSQTSLNLTSGQPATVTLTPLAVSQAPNDVQIIATGPDGLTAQGSLTIVNITIPDISNADTPYGMPDRIPPTANTALQITVQPDLTGTNQSVTLAKLGSGGNNGDFTINGGSTASITTTSTVSFSGTTQTATAGAGNGPSGNGGENAGNLSVVAQVRGQNAVQSAGFSVAAIPQNFTDMYSQTFTPAAPFTFTQGGPPFVGMGVQDGLTSDSVTSDSGSSADLGQVQYEEQLVQAGQGNGVFARTSIAPNTCCYVPAATPAKDAHAIPIYYLTGSGAGMPAGFQQGVGTIAFNQVQVFRDYRTGVVDIPMTNSGFTVGQQITTTIAQDGTVTYHLTTTKAGANEAVTGTNSSGNPATYSSSAGAVTQYGPTPKLIQVVQP